MKIFVISLKHSFGRREKIEKKLNSLKLPFYFFDAVDGRNDHHKIFKHYNNKKRVAIKGYPLKSGELGCFASHFSLWEKCVELDEPLLILEDDIEIKDTFINMYREISSLIETIPYFRIGRILNAKYKKIKKVNDNHHLVIYEKSVCGTQGYAISPKAAKELINSTYEWYEPVDDFMEKEWLHDVLNFGLEPPLVCHDLSFDSEIGERAKPYASMKTKIRRELYRSYSLIRKLKYSIKKYKIVKFYKDKLNDE